ncbi:hypothetical protein [Azospirillum halopraeferens]|uniref:hypothetical protein n=1 Tax=Azospirillum halopraeferens TaxID=34010 RepID=UPI0004247D40|nr:hypothetical protein [Azospirillum halopraeferens]
MTAPAPHPFTAIAPGIAHGAPLPAGWRSLADADVLVLVGVTGAGKSTALAALDARGVEYTLLPDRRVVTDRVIIPRYAGGPVADRVQRFAITRAFTRDVPGGMAAVLGELAADGPRCARPLVFDGLRGEAEVAHAVALLPRARFLALTAPDPVRMMRLLGRGDAFDSVAPTGAAAPAGAAELELADPDGILSPADVERLRVEVAAGRLDAAEVRAKFAIIAAERRNYDPDRTVAVLRTLAPERSAVVDTTRAGPGEVGAVLARLLVGLPATSPVAAPAAVAA